MFRVSSTLGFSKEESRIWITALSRLIIADHLSVPVLEELVSFLSLCTASSSPSFSISATWCCPKVSITSGCFHSAYKASIGKTCTEKDLLSRWYTSCISAPWKWKAVCILIIDVLVSLWNNNLDSKTELGDPLFGYKLACKRRGFIHMLLALWPSAGRRKVGLYQKRMIIQQNPALTLVCALSSCRSRESFLNFSKLTLRGWNGAGWLDSTAVRTKLSLRLHCSSPWVSCNNR
ncbi:hypothetical protein AVEN_82592-1 [Araneus ventricosus]|uniref:PH domain-containing protein n=1 Tax=Araneus ventricosus TaxID=182803 RepID=A0A4Y2CRH4_ARAVE|nr:hypothetical protein AVEN_82592-1 [Araneus ventricosus]